MLKTNGKYQLDTETNTLFYLRDNERIELEWPWDFSWLYERSTTFEWLKENYSNPDKELWEIALKTRDMMDDEESFESEFIDDASSELGITLQENEA